MQLFVLNGMKDSSMIKDEELRKLCNELAKDSIVVDALERFIYQIIKEISTNLRKKDEQA